MSNADRPLLLCLAAAAASGVVPIREAAPHLKDLDDKPRRPYWPALRRALHRIQEQAAWADSPEWPSYDGRHVRWCGQEIGTLLRLHKATLPQEQQARIAYETFLTRFFDYMWEEHHCAVLPDYDNNDNGAEAILFVPQTVPFALDEVWTTYVAHAFSLPELRRSFLLVLNSVKLSRQGFSPPDLPPVTKDHAVALLGFYNASVKQRDSDMRRKEWRIKEARGPGERTRLEKELAKNHANYDAAIAAMEGVIKGLEAGVRRRVGEISESMTRTGCTQIGPRPDYMAACVTRSQEVVSKLAAGEFATIRPLVTLDPPLTMARPAGDDVRQACYVCGTLLAAKEGAEVSKLVVESPSQALQSSPRERRPLACPTCMQVCMLCPIKPTDQAVIVSLRRGTDGPYLYDDHLRQMVLGELNLIAGRYCQITCTERIKEANGVKPLSQSLGQVQYAMLKVADLFPADSLRDNTVVVSIDGGDISVPRRQTVALAGLLEILDVRPTTVSASRHNLALFSSAVRLLQADRYHEAVYEMIGAFRRGDDLSPVARAHLDTLTGTITQTWQGEMQHKGNKGGQHVATESAQPDGDRDLRTYRDVLALTGLLVPFISAARHDLAGQVQTTIDRELSKLIEHVEGKPQEFCYDLAQALKSYAQAIPSALLSVTQDTRTIATEALDLLREAGIEVPRVELTPGATVANDLGEEGQQGRTAYRLTIDTLQGIYLYLYEKRYHTPKARHDLAYQLKLSLYARFPRLVTTRNKE